MSVIKYTCKGMAAFAAFQKLTPLVAGRRWRKFSLNRPVKAGRLWRWFRHTPCGAAALRVVPMVLTCKGGTALAAFQRLSPLARRRWRYFSLHIPVKEGQHIRDLHT